MKNCKKKTDPASQKTVEKKKKKDERVVFGAILVQKGCNVNVVLVLIIQVFCELYQMAAKSTFGVADIDLFWRIRQLITVIHAFSEAI